MNKVKKLIMLLSLGALALCLAGLTACGETKKPDPPPDDTPTVTITLSKTSETVEAGASFVLTATVTGSTDAPAFSSSDTAIATVAGSGKNATVKGVAAGTATITAKIGEKSATCAVSVTAPPVEEKLSLDREYAVLEDGGATFKTATVTATCDGAATFASSDEIVFTVTTADNVATLTALKTGTATLTATYGSKTATCTVEVATYGLDYQLVELDLDEETTITALRVLDSDKDLTGEVRIPARFWSEEEEDYFPVAVVADEGFKGNEAITSVYLGDEMLKVGDNAFKECTALVSAICGPKLQTIGAGAFNTCEALTTFTWAEDCVVTTLGAGAFAWSALTEFTVPATATGFNWGMFQCCEQLETVKIYAPITDVWDSAFLKCDSLKEIWLPATLTKIAGGAFGGYAGFPDDGPGSKGSMTVNFAGTQAQWDAIDINSSNNGAIVKGTNKNLTINYEVEY